MATDRQIKAMELYRSLMEEVNVRVSAINYGISGSLFLLPPSTVREFCFLQIRMICELVALGCLVAHGDIPHTKSLEKKWAAGEILTVLEKLHPDFFPVRVEQTKTPLGYHFDFPENQMAKAEFLNLYDRCGSYLHKGSLKNLLKKNFPKQLDFPEIAKAAQRVIDLLGHHVVKLIGGEMYFICALKNIETGGVQVAIAEANELQSP